MNIDPKIFYKSGIACFSIVAVCSIINFFIFYSLGNIFSHIASIASIVFNCVLVGFFYYLLKSQTTDLPVEKTESLSEALEEFKKNVK